MVLLRGRERREKLIGPGYAERERFEPRLVRGITLDVYERCDDHELYYRRSRWSCLSASPIGGKRSISRSPGFRPWMPVANWTPTSPVLNHGQCAPFLWGGKSRFPLTVNHSAQNGDRSSAAP